MVDVGLNPTRPEPPAPAYLGDGVYASFDGYHINLAVNHHTNHVVALESSVIISLIEYARQLGFRTESR